VSDAAATDTILVTGASGVIGSRLVDRLLAGGRRVRVAGRRLDRLRARWPDVEAVELDVLRPETLEPALDGVRVAHYLVHSMEPGTGGAFRERDATGASAFARAASSAGLDRVVYLGGLGREGDELSEHLESRQETGRILAEDGPPLVELRAAMVIGADSASYRMLTDLVRRLPAMVLPRWVSTPSQPIALDDVVSYLSAAVDLETADRHVIFEIGGPDVLTYRDMIEIVARDRGRHPVLVAVPFLTPKLSSYWCAITTSVPMATAQPLIAGMTVPTVVHSDAARAAFPGIRPMPFRDALARATAEAGRGRSGAT
jgi:uncharacterized protein YbjT (DUF2867 family)